MFVQPLPETFPVPPALKIAIEPPPNIPLSTHSTHTSSYAMNSPNPVDFMANLSPDAGDWADHSPVSPSFPTNPYLYDLLVDQPPPSTLPSGASSALTSEASSALASEVNSPWTSGANSALASEASSPLASGANSALTSDPDLPLPSSTKATKQTNLFGFFQKVAPEELHVKWQKRKRDNEDQDKEEFVERKRQDEADKLSKLVNKCARNSVSQKKW